MQGEHAFGPSVLVSMSRRQKATWLLRIFLMSWEEIAIPRQERLLEWYLVDSLRLSVACHFWA